jgi:hypothetical protein
LNNKIVKRGKCGCVVEIENELLHKENIRQADQYNTAFGWGTNAITLNDIK